MYRFIYVHPCLYLCIICRETYMNAHYLYECTYIYIYVMILYEQTCVYIYICLYLESPGVALRASPRLSKTMIHRDIVVQHDAS